jgi:hypothetical protein
MPQHSNDFLKVVMLTFTFIHLAKGWDDYSKMKINEFEKSEVIDAVANVTNCKEQEILLSNLFDRSFTLFKTDWSIAVNQMINKVAALESSERKSLKDILLNRIQSDDMSLSSIGMLKAKDVINLL